MPLTLGCGLGHFGVRPWPLSGRHGVEVEFAGGDGDGARVGLGVTFGVGNQEGKVGPGRKPKTRIP